MKREIFETPEVEVIMYTNDDIITTSSEEWEDRENMLPILPAE